VLTRDESFAREGVTVVHTVAQALSAAADAVVEKIAEGGCAPEVYVIGGEQVYRQLLPWCTTAWVTKMETLVPADRFFPDLDAEDGWRLDTPTY
jgi:dihydrofolate reductase